MTRNSWLYQILITSTLMALTTIRAVADDHPQWGQYGSRNMVSDEVGLPATFDPATGENIKWVASVGTESYSTPVVGQGRVIIGANNNRPRDPRHQGRRGVLLCLDEKTGQLQWQLVIPKFKGDYYLDWPNAGICSSAVIEGDRVYIVSCRSEVLCLDLNGQANGNDGPFTDEGRLMVPDGQQPMDITPLDADVIWRYDMVHQSGIHHHDATHSAPLILGDYIYVNSNNGVDRTHHFIPSPDAPSLIVLDKKTGRLVAQDGERIGPHIVHCTWSSPAYGVVNGQPLVFFGGGDGVCYAFKPVGASAPGAAVQTLERVWRFDCDPTAPKENIHDYMRNRKVSASNIMGTPVFLDKQIFVAVGGDIWWGKNEAWLQCIDATQTGDVTKTALKWSYPVSRHCCSTPAIKEGLVYISDVGGVVHCVDVETGKPYWTHRANGDMFASTLVADGKVYVGTRRGTFWVFAEGKEKKVLASIDLGASTCSAAVAANGVLYVATLEQLFAVEFGAHTTMPETE